MFFSFLRDCRGAKAGGLPLWWAWLWWPWWLWLAWPPLALLFTAFFFFLLWIFEQLILEHLQSSLRPAGCHLLHQ
jgi:hypothetical protein